MNPLKIIPLVASLGVLAVAGAKVLSELIEEEFDNKETSKKEEVNETKDKASNIKIANAATLIYNRAIKKTQNELARAYDIKMLNTRLEHTGCVGKINISFDGENIEDYIKRMETDLDSYIAQSNKFKNA